ncbi:Nn.00g074960.m01.CDS01 [Neocucurbitaria sp. VM-36]
MAPIPAHKSSLADTPPTPVAAPQRPADAHTSTSIADDASATPPPSATKTKKRKRTDTEKPHILHQSTFRKPTWSYFHLRLITPGTASASIQPQPQPPLPSSTTPQIPSTSTISDIDPLTTSTLLSHPLTQHLGTTGSAIPIDMLKTRHRDVWVRVPRQDARAFRAGLSAWVGSWEGEGIPGIGGGGEGGRSRLRGGCWGRGGFWGVWVEGMGMGMGMGVGRRCLGEEGGEEEDMEKMKIAGSTTYWGVV